MRNQRCKRGAKPDPLRLHINLFVECEPNQFENQTTSFGGLLGIEPVLWLSEGVITWSNNRSGYLVNKAHSRSHEAEHVKHIPVHTKHIPDQFTFADALIMWAHYRVLPFEVFFHESSG